MTGMDASDFGFFCHILIGIFALDYAIERLVRWRRSCIRHDPGDRNTDRY